MPGIDQTREFVPLKIAVLTVSDTRSLTEDKSGATLAERIEKAGHAVAARAIVTDDVERIRAQVRAWIADPAIDVVIT
ncbi:MAG: molybdenum cofactor biosynthesis protein B, partial [Xanthobacteraceae bacterium]|nr:molybdenum cofactor biosynthesis protein B [Xanthobacteraceae bacterium]